MTGVTASIFRPILPFVLRSVFRRAGDRRFLAVVVLLVLALALRFLLPYWWYGAPLGYDAGLYRYLFLVYSRALPLSWPDLPLWAREHPPGLFLLAFPFLKAGLPADWLIGWMWPVAAVAPACAIAWAAGKRWGREVGALTLLMAVLSVAYFDGYAAMYWKTYVSLCCCVFAFHFLERGRWPGFVFAFLTVAVHHQTGLLFGLSVVTYWMLSFPARRRDPQWYVGAGALAIVAGGALLLYAPLWDMAVRSPLQGLLTLQGDNAPAGSFPPFSFYLRWSCILLGLGCVGFIVDVRRERGTPWQCAALWCAVFIVLRLVFYRRFFLQLDFFLLPFAALAVSQLWSAARTAPLRAGIVLLLSAQAGLSIAAATEREPAVPRETVEMLADLQRHVPENAAVLDLENASAWMLRGYLPDRRVGAPGVFGGGWPYEQWETFLLGTSAERSVLLGSLPGPLYIFVSPFFRSYYGADVNAFLADPCFEPTELPWLLRSRCSPVPAATRP